MTIEVLAVDEENQVLNSVSREEAHHGDGIRHRAFTVVVRDENGRILLARRSEDKTLWPGYWDGTVASHQESEGRLEAAASERLEEELGIRPPQYDGFERLEDFEYKAFYGDGGVEWEICSLLVVELHETELELNPSEVSEVRWEYPGSDLQNRIENYSLMACPWFEIVLEKLQEQSDPDIQAAEGD